jgi:ribosome silencing factor RsfS/YbeB/iojap
MQKEMTITVDHEGLAKAFIATQIAAGKKGENIKILDLRDCGGFTDFFLICSGRSDRQIQAIADSIVIELKEQGVQPISVEGYREGRWVVVDYGDLVIHIFLDALRDYYELEQAWTGSHRVQVPVELFYTAELN